MKLTQINKNFLNSIKVLSTILITSAIGLEIWNIYLRSTSQPIPSILEVVILVERFALAIHFFEGIVAFFLAYPKGKRPIQYGIYTFFTGTVSLLELWEVDS